MAEVALSAASKAAPPLPPSHALVLRLHEVAALRDDVEVDVEEETPVHAVRSNAAENAVPAIGNERTWSPDDQTSLSDLYVTH